MLDKENLLQMMKQYMDMDDLSNLSVFKDEYCDDDTHDAVSGTIKVIESIKSSIEDVKIHEELIEKAKGYAFTKHDQPSKAQRYGSQPYSKHLIDVMGVAAKYLYLIRPQDRENVMCGCALHDTVEDTDTTPNDIKSQFNYVVADLVYRVSNERGLSKKEIMFKTLPKIWENELAIFIKLSDRIANGTNSKMRIDAKSETIYNRYLEEYPIFRYALRIKDKSGNILYSEMWTELDEIFEYSL